MKRIEIKNKTTLTKNDSYQGLPLERKIERIVQQNEPITDGAPLIFTERKDGVVAGYDVRTDRFEVAIEAMDVVTKSNIAKRTTTEVKKVETTEKTDVEKAS